MHLLQAASSPITTQSPSPYVKFKERKHPNMTSSLKGQVALITGATQGVDLSIAIALAHEGVSLILFNRSAHQLDTFTSVELWGGGLLYFTIC